MRYLIFPVILSLLLLSGRAYAICDDLNVQQISLEGTKITLSNGQIWLAREGNSAIGWGIHDDVVMCGDGIMINHDQNESVSVRRIR